MFDVPGKLSFVPRIRCIIHGLVNFGLSGIVVLTEICDLGAKDVGCSVEPGNVGRDNCVDVRKGSGHFSYFFEYNVMG